MQPSRRAFLSGRKPAPSAWEAFCRRLGSACDGVFEVSTEDGDAGRARFAPAGHGDMAVAVSLARAYGVVLALVGDAGAVTTPPADRPAVYVDPHRLDRLTPVFAAASQAAPVAWDAQPGCRLGTLADAGLTQFEGAPRDRTLAQWLAAPHPRLAPGATDATGIVGIEVLLADGTFEALGPFGADATQPLQSATVQALVPVLFQLASSPDGRLCRACEGWPLAYRLDALAPSAPHTVNLGQLLLGHGGTLAWVCRVRMIAMPAGVESATLSPIAIDRAAPEDAGRRLTRRIKDAFDPGCLFPMPG